MNETLVKTLRYCESGCVKGLLARVAFYALADMSSRIVLIGAPGYNRPIFLRSRDLHPL